MTFTELLSVPSDHLVLFSIGCGWR